MDSLGLQDDSLSWLQSNWRPLLHGGSDAVDPGPWNAASRLVCSSNGAASVHRGAHDAAAGNVQGCPVWQQQQQYLHHQQQPIPLHSAPQATIGMEVAGTTLSWQPKRRPTQAQFEAHKRYRFKKKVTVSGL